jgi:hypothetical protein
LHCVATATYHGIETNDGMLTGQDGTEIKSEIKTDKERLETIKQVNQERMGAYQEKNGRQTEE